MRDSSSRPPKGLSPEARALWRRLTTDYAIADAGGLAILAAGLEAFDRMRSVQAEIALAGATFRDRFGQLRAHPGVAIERDARSAWLGALKQLNLDLEPLRDGPGRPAGQIGG